MLACVRDRRRPTWPPREVAAPRIVQDLVTTSPLKSRTMTHKISILVRADMKSQSIDLVVTGCLNSDTAEALHRQITRARGLAPATPVLVDLSGTRHVDPLALSTLRHRVDASHMEGAGKRLVDVDFRLPKTVAACEPAHHSQLTAG